MAKKKFEMKKPAQGGTADAMWDRFADNEYLYKQQIKDKLQIHEELEPYIQPLKEEEFQILSENILKTGEVREKLIVWETQDKEYFLLDGHHRYKVIQANPKADLNWDIDVQKNLHKLEDAKRFMRQIQLGRRNLTTNQMAYLRGRTYLDMKKEVGRSDSNDGRTREILAEEFKVAPATINRDAVFALGVDRFLGQGDTLKTERSNILVHESVFLKGEVELLGKHPELPLTTAYQFKQAGGSLKAIVKEPQAEWESLMESFLVADQKVSDKPSKNEKDRSTPSQPVNKFVKWWDYENKQIDKIVKKGTKEDILHKRQELSERMKEIQSLLEKLPEK